MSTKLLKMEVVVGERTVEHSLETTVDLDREALSILNIDAHVKHIEATVAEGQVVLDGELEEAIWFIGRDNRVFRQAAVVPFMSAVAVTGAEVGQRAIVRASVLRVSFELDDDQLRERILLQFFVKVVETAQLNVVLSAAGPLLKTEVVVGENVVPAAAVQEIHLDRRCIKVRDVFVQVDETEAEVLHGQVLVRGRLGCNIIYIAHNNVAFHQAAELPFTTVAIVPGAAPGMNADVRCNLLRVNRLLVNDGQAVQVQALLQVFCKCTETAQVAVETSALGPLVRTMRVAKETTKSAIIENVTDLDLPAQCVQTIDALIRDLRAEVLQNAVVLHGTLHKQIFFVGPDDVLRHQAEDSPFSLLIDLPDVRPGMDAHVRGHVLEVHFDLRDPTDQPRDDVDDDDFDDFDKDESDGDLFRELEQRVVVEFFVKVSEDVQLNVLTAELSPALRLGA